MGGHSCTSGSLTCLDPSELSWVRGDGVVLASKQESMHNPGGSLQSVDAVERLSAQGPHPLGDGHEERWKVLFKRIRVDIQRDAGWKQSFGSFVYTLTLLLLLLSRFVASVVSDSVRLHRRQPTRLPCPWDSPGKNTGVGCHFLLQCMKVKSQSEVAQSCPTLRNPMDCSLPGSSIHGIFQARVLEWGAIAFSNTLTLSVC